MVHAIHNADLGVESRTLALCALGERVGEGEGRHEEGGDCEAHGGWNFEVEVCGRKVLMEEWWWQWWWYCFLVVCRHVFYTFGSSY